MHIANCSLTSTARSGYTKRYHNRLSVSERKLGSLPRICGRSSCYAVLHNKLNPHTFLLI